MVFAITIVAVVNACSGIFGSTTFDGQPAVEYSDATLYSPKRNLSFVYGPLQ